MGVYETTTSLGTTYYWRGDVKDNYLIFANKYWRIIRINEDGSVRIIYSGEKSEIDAAGKETVLANGYDDGDTSYLTIGSSVFNSTRAGNYYVGYTYIEGYQRPSLAPNIEEEQDSTIKEILDSWYNTNLGNNSNYDSKVVNTPGFCNDRELVSTSLTLYKAYERILSTYAPIFDCNNSNDLYQTKVGLITADEASFAGGKGQSSNSSYYLYRGGAYWTISPSDFYGNLAWIFSINYNGAITQYTSTDQLGIRPVINIAADVIITGEGTINSPYIITEN